MRAFLLITAVCIALSVSGGAAAGADLYSETVSYQQGGEELRGYLAYDKADTRPRPAVLVVHEWWGLNDYIKGRVHQLAGLGYVVFAADIYGNGFTTKDPQEAGKLAGKFRGDRQLLRNRAKAGLQVLQGQPLADQKRIAAIGYCFGGTAVLELARSGAPVAGTVTFHGGLDTPTPEDAKNIQGKVLALHGADDTFVPPAQVSAFQEEMRKGKVDWQMVLYGGAVHSFTNPDNGTDTSRGLAYNAKADRRSWEHMRLFFAEIFQ